MTAVELLPPSLATPDNEEWHKLRRAGISASEIAAVLGISPWESPFSLYWRKVNDWRGDDNAEMTAGRRAEQVIADWFVDWYMDNVLHPDDGFATRSGGLYANAERPWQLATPDRLLFLTPGTDDALDMDERFDDDPWPDEIVECKYLVHSWDGWGEPGTDQVPVHYRAQCLWQADVLDCDRVWLAAWHGAEFRCYLVRRDEKDLTLMREAGRRFMDRLEAGDPPPVDDHTATLATLRQLHPGLDDTDADVPADLAANYRRACRMAKLAEGLKKRREAELRAVMGRARKATSGGLFVASRSIYTVAEHTVAEHTVDRLNPAREKKQ